MKIEKRKPWPGKVPVTDFYVPGWGFFFSVCLHVLFSHMRKMKNVTLNMQFLWSCLSFLSTTWKIKVKNALTWDQAQFKRFSEHKCSPSVLAAGVIFRRMRAWGWKELPINKMADHLPSYIERQICVARGIVSWGGEDGAAGELQLWDHESLNEHYIYTRKKEGDCKTVCKDVDVFTLHFQNCTDKIKTFLTKQSKFHFVQYWKQNNSTMWEWTDKGVSSRCSKVRMCLCSHFNVSVVVNFLYWEFFLFFVCFWVY